MGQKVHPYGFRLGVNRTWRSLVCEKDYGALLHEDLRLKTMLKKKFSHAGISRRNRAGGKQADYHHLHLPPRHHRREEGARSRAEERHAAVDRKGCEPEDQEVSKPELDSQLVSEGIAQQRKTDRVPPRQPRG